MDYTFLHLTSLLSEIGVSNIFSSKEHLWHRHCVSLMMSWCGTNWQNNSLIFLNHSKQPRWQKCLPQYFIFEFRAKTKLTDKADNVCGYWIPCKYLLSVFEFISSFYPRNRTINCTPLVQIETFLFQYNIYKLQTVKRISH